MKPHPHNEGFVLPAALIFLLLGALVIGCLLTVSRQTVPVADSWREYDECLLAAQSALEKVKLDIYQGFREEHMQNRSWDDLGWIVDHAPDFCATGTVDHVLGAGVLVGRDYLAAEVDVAVSSGPVIGISAEEREVVVTNRVTASWGGISRIIEEVVRYRLNRSSVFDYVYFINNFGWFYGVDCVVNGDIRSNYDVELKSRDLVLNGHTYAAGVNDLKRPYQSWSWETYRYNSLSDYFRPLYHVDANKHNVGSIYDWGYDDSGRHNYVSELDMPYIGTLGDYRVYAQEQHGTVTNSSGVVISNVYSGAGPSGIDGAADQGCVHLKGTQSDPIVIDGPVVVEGDLIIEGYYTGQGTLYAGRNIHVIGDLVALESSHWDHPDTATNFYGETLPDNLDRDFMGLVARGSVVLGDPDDLSSYQSYFKPPFTDEYEVLATDADIGYVSYTQDGASYFDGDYTASSGVRCDSSNSSNAVARCFFDPSVSSAMMQSFSPATRINRLDAFIYNNHLTVGQFGSQSMINGGVICRDEALIPAGRVYLNWDPRVSMDNDFTPFLPLELGPAETISWREVLP